MGLVEQIVKHRGIPSQFLDTGDEDTSRVIRAVLHESEVSNLGALGGRSGSTLIGTLLKMLMGERVGFTNVQSTREPLEAHSYRLAMTVQVQPDSAVWQHAPSFVAFFISTTKMIWRSHI